MKSRVPDAFLRRAKRAEELAATSEVARAPLEFAALLYRAQRDAAMRLCDRDLSGDQQRDRDQVVAAAREVIDLGANRFSDELLSRAVLRPYLEILAASKQQIAKSDGPCPFCGGQPWIASRRSITNTDGAARVLGCAWCATEWGVNRIVCPACSESDPVKLPSFSGDAFPAVRIEACESCHRYLKSIDLSLDARPIPEVDDLLSLSLDLWARDRGFARLEPGLAGI